jgi:hypothetical protein
MKVHPTIIGIAVCTVIGGAVAYFSSVKWLAAALWVFAAMYVNGTIAVIEDDQPGGFDNPDGTSPQLNASKQRRMFFASLAIAFGAIAAGAYVQFR